MYTAIEHLDKLIELTDLFIVDIKQYDKNNLSSLQSFINN